MRSPSEPNRIALRGSWVGGILAGLLWLRSKRGAEASHPVVGIESTPAQIDLLSLGPPRLRAPGITASQALQEQREERF